MGAKLQYSFTRDFLGDIVKRSATASTVGSIQTQLQTTVQGFNKVYGDAIQSGFGNVTYDFVKGIPLSPSFTLGSFVGEIKNAAAGNKTSFDSLSNVLADVTGVNLNLISEKFTSVTSVEERIKEFVLSIERQVIFEIKDCIDGYLQSLLNRNPEIEILLDLEGALIKELSKLRRKLRLEIEGEIEALLYKRIKIQQIASFKQKITSAIRKICPGSHHSLAPVQRISPSLTKRLQTDTTWKLPDGVTPLKEIALKTSPEAVHYVERTDSTGQLVVDLASDAVTEISNEGRVQAVGYADTTMDDLFDDNGDLV